MEPSIFSTSRHIGIVICRRYFRLRAASPAISIGNIFDHAMSPAASTGNRRYFRHAPSSSRPIIFDVSSVRVLWAVGSRSMLPSDKRCPVHFLSRGFFCSCLPCFKHSICPTLLLLAIRTFQFRMLLCSACFMYRWSGETFVCQGSKCV